MSSSQEIIVHPPVHISAMRSEAPCHEAAQAKSSPSHEPKQTISYKTPPSPMPSIPLKSVDVHIPTRASKQIEKSRARDLSSTMSTVSRSTRPSRANSIASSYETNATSVLPALQHKAVDDADGLEPLTEEDFDPASFDLLAPPDRKHSQYSLETRSDLLFSRGHLEIIFDDPTLLLRFTSFLSSHRPQSIPILIYYLDAIKALKAISYANAIAEALDPIRGHEFTATGSKPTTNTALEDKAQQAFDVMVRDDLPAYITHVYIQTVSLSIKRRVTGTLPTHLRDSSEGLAEVFCLTDPSRPDNPIVFASEEFHRTTQYGMDYVIGRNCRFLQGPKTNPFSVKRIRDKILAGQEHSEVFLNYRRDGSPFMNLLMCAPLCDSRGKVRYFIGAQVDVSGLVKECSDLESLRRLITKTEKEEKIKAEGIIEEEPEITRKDEFQELSEMLNLQELDTVRKWGGRMHKESSEETQETSGAAPNWNQPRLLIHDLSPPLEAPRRSQRGKLLGIYDQYLLVRPYPSLHILFASPSLRIPGILQTPFLSKIGGSARVRDELSQAFADGRGVTAKVRWTSRHDIQGRNRWIHCTPLLGHNGAIGVWMVVVVDDENETAATGTRRFRDAPPVDPRSGREMAFRDGDGHSLRDFAMLHGAQNGSIRSPSIASSHAGAQSSYSL